MPPKGIKRERAVQLSKARESKRSKLADGEGSSRDGLEEEIPTFSDYDSAEDETFSPSTEELDEDAAMKLHVEDWLNSLHRDDIMTFTLLLHQLLVNRMQIPVTEASKLIGETVKKSDRTVREYRSIFNGNEYSFPDSLQGKYQRKGVLWQNEKLNKLATKFVRENAAVKGRPNMTARSFCHWVNDDLLPNEALEPGYPRRIAVDTSRRWLHELGFCVLDQKKGVYIDGHERDDVIEYRKKFIRKVVALGFINKDKAPSQEAAECLPKDLECPPADVVDKTIVIFHDESIFSVNEDQHTQWGTSDTVTIKPKGKGAGIMVSDFVDEHNGYLRLNDEEFGEAKKLYGSTMKKEARVFLEYGEGKEGYWTSERFLAQMDIAVKIAEIKYPKTKGYKVIWVFDNSSCHNAYADDALIAAHMNAKPGGKQPAMRDTIWNGRPQKMVFNIGVPKGLIQVLRERKRYVPKMKLEEMRREITTHSDFANEKTKLEHYLQGRGHCCIMLPKFHCELNPIERCWGQAKRYTRAYANYTFPGLRKNIPLGLNSVTIENIRNYFRKTRQYMFAYVEGFAAGPEMEKQIKKYKKLYKSHRKVGVNE